MSELMDRTESLVKKWIQQEKDGVSFPVPLDTAWVIAGYSRVDSAKRAVKTYFIEGEEYSTQSGKPQGAGRPAQEVFLSCDGFKELCMLSKSDDGRSTRKYFIEAEKTAVKLFEASSDAFALNGNIKELVGASSAAIDIIFEDINPDLRKGMKVESAIALFPELRPALEPHKPKVIVAAPLVAPKRIGEILAELTGEKWSSQRVNKALIAINFQEKTGQKNPAYRPIGQGCEFGQVVVDTASGHGKTVQATRWYESIAERILELGK